MNLDGFPFPIDFYFLNKHEYPSPWHSVLLGRPFLKTAKVKIDVSEGSLSIECEGKLCVHNDDAFTNPFSCNKVLPL